MDKQKLSSEELTAMEYLQATLRRRELFAKVFTPAVLAELESFLGVKDVIFAFAPVANGRTDPYIAARQDALLGVMRALRYELEHLEETRESMKRVEEELNKR